MFYSKGQMIQEFQFIRKRNNLLFVGAVKVSTNRGSKLIFGSAYILKLINCNYRATIPYASMVILIPYYGLDT